jgi:hypothetical protein
MYSWRAKYNQRITYNQWPFRRCTVKKGFLLFLYYIFRNSAIEIRRKSSNFSLTGEKNFEQNNFFSTALFYHLFFGGEQFLLNFKPYSNWPIYTNSFCQKSAGSWGDFFELFGLKSVDALFSQNHCAVSITNAIRVLQHCSMTPLSPGHG